MSGFAISRAQSDRLKGAAILLMMAHHLFGLPTLIEPPNAYMPLIPGLPFEYWIGRFGKICVAMFLLLSGYGFAVGAQGRSMGYFAGKAWRFLLAYWPYFLLAFAAGHLFFQERMANGNLRFPTDPLDIALNALALKNTMAFEWWFAETYMLLVLATGSLLWAARWRLALLAGSGAAFVAGSVMDMARFDTPVVSIANLLIWQLPWVIGIVLARPLPALVASILTTSKVVAGLLLSVVLGFALVERFAGFAMTPFLIVAAPVVVVASATLWRQPRSGGALQWLGSYTLGLWLVHPFFCYYFFQTQIYAPRLSPLVFAAVLAASLAVVLPVEWLRKVAARRSLRAT